MTGDYRLPFPCHPLRGALYDELHARPFQVLSTPHLLSHIAFKADPADLETALALVRDLCRRCRVPEPAADAVSFQQDLGSFSLRWERHLEFYALTFKRADAVGEPFRSRVIDRVPGEWLATLPGQAVAAFHIAVGDERLDTDIPLLEEYFDGHPLVISEPKDGRAFLCTAFKLHADGFGRFLIKNLGLSDYQMGRLVQRIIELETYRLLAQLSIPLAKRLSPPLGEMDRQLAEILARVPQMDNSDGEREMLERLSLLSTRLETFRAETNTRFSATKAYHALVATRLQNIQEQPVEGFMTAREFMTRRLAPGMRTCESVQNLMEDLSRRIERAGDLLRTRVNLTMQEQNKILLAAMNRRGRLQFRLQETVEGLSVAAISYYLVGLLGYLLAGLPLEEHGVEKKYLQAMLVPIVLGGVWLAVGRLKHRIIREPLREEASCEPG